MSSPSSYQEKAQIIGDEKQADATFVDVIRNAKKYVNICGDSALPKFTLSETIRKAYQQAKRKGVKIRYITEITKDNLAYCKEIMKFAEVRHLNKIVGNFITTDRDYLGQSSGHNFLSHLIYTDDDRMLEQHNHVFENLWNNATTQQDKISSLRSGNISRRSKSVI